jgi:hypothetical protein
MIDTKGRWLLPIEDVSSFDSPYYLICISAEPDYILYTQNIFNYLDNTNSNNFIELIVRLIYNVSVQESINFCLELKPSVLIEHVIPKTHNNDLITHMDRIEYVIYH